MHRINSPTELYEKLHEIATKEDITVEEVTTLFLTGMVISYKYPESRYAKELIKNFKKEKIRQS